MKRRLLGKVSGAATRQRVFLIENGVEVDDIDHFEVTRRRVFFDDVVSLTRHRYLGWPYIITLALLMAGSLALAFISRDEPAVLAIFAAPAVFFALLIVLRLILGVDVITMSGRRTRAVMRFSLRKKQAQRVFNELEAAIGVAQKQAAAEMARQEPAPHRPPEPLPAPPSE